MIKGRSVLAIIPARGGSKGLPGKNIVDLGGKPLIAWTIEAAHSSKYIDRLILTSNDEDIMNVAEKYGCEVPFIRPEEFSKDDSPTMEALFHAFLTLEESYDMVVLLQPTSPFRKREDIDGCIKLAHENNCPVVSVTEADKSPYWMFQLENGKMSPFLESKATRRQDLPKAYYLNGAVYVSTEDDLMHDKTFINSKTLAFEMPKNRAIDVDTQADLNYARYLALTKHH